jgi:branched-chain amino acid transport system permease protein
MNLLYGYVGLMPLMFAGIAGISAYGTVHLTMKAGWSFWAAMPLASVFAAAIGVVLGLPSLRLKGFYFTLYSLVIQTVLTLVFVSLPAWTNGDTGISQIPAPDIPFRDPHLTGLGFNLILGAIAVAGVLSVAGIVAARLGCQLIAVREDDTLAETIGIDVIRAKVVAFFLGSLYAAIGGAFYATYIGFISPRSFDVLASLNLWLMVAFGGRGSVIGPIIGTIILVPIPFILQDYYMLKDVVYGTLIILVIMLMPAGVYGEITKRLDKRRTVTPTAAAGEQARP